MLWNSYDPYTNTWGQRPWHIDAIVRPSRQSKFLSNDMQELASAKVDDFTSCDIFFMVRAVRRAKFLFEELKSMKARDQPRWIGREPDLRLYVGNEPHDEAFFSSDTAKIQATAHGVLMKLFFALQWAQERPETWWGIVNDKEIMKSAALASELLDMADERIIVAFTENRLYDDVEDAQAEDAHAGVTSADYQVRNPIRGTLMSRTRFELPDNEEHVLDVSKQTLDHEPFPDWMDVES